MTNLPFGDYARNDHTYREQLSVLVQLSDILVQMRFHKDAKVLQPGTIRRMDELYVQFTQLKSKRNIAGAVHVAKEIIDVYEAGF